jgi:hypothetical protein
LLSAIKRATASHDEILFEQIYYGKKTKETIGKVALGRFFALNVSEPLLPPFDCTKHQSMSVVEINPKDKFYTPQDS